MTKQINGSGRVSDLLGDLQIDIRDIARGLSKINRYNGQTNVPYSVAQHSVLVSKLCLPVFSFAGLMHDAHEAYFGDMPTYVKRLLDHYTLTAVAAVEYRLAVKVRKYFGLCPEFHESVKEADIRARGIEVPVLFDYPAAEQFANDGVALEYASPFLDRVWGYEEAYEQFMYRFVEVSPFS